MKRAIIQNIEEAKHKVRESSTASGLSLFILLPTLIAAVYFYIIAANVYVSETKFSVNVEGRALPTSSSGVLMSALSTSNNIREAMMVREYILSRDMLENLIKKSNIKAVYDYPTADFLSRVPRDMKIEDYLLEYRKKIVVVLDEVNGITTLKVRAFNPSDSKKIADAILNESENFVNQMAQRVREDAIEYAKNEVKKSEEMVLEINQKIADLRNKNRNFNPAMTASGVLDITKNLEVELAETKAEIANLLNYMKASSPKVVALQAKAKTLQQQIDEQSGRLAGAKGSALASLAEQYESLNMQRDLNLKKLEIALSSLQAAQAEARKKSTYLLRIVEPSVPEDAVEPERFIGLLTVFFTCVMIYTFGGLIIAAIRDHIRP